MCEGTGDYCSEYMTGSVVVALGTVGRHVGIGYFYDEDCRFDECVNGEIVKMQRVKTVEGGLQLKNIIEGHFEKTGSEKAEMILDNWDEEVGKFWQVYPPSEPILGETVKISATSPSQEICYLPVGGQMTPDQTKEKI